MGVVMVSVLALAFVPLVGIFVAYLVVSDANGELRQNDLPDIEQVCSGELRALVEESCQSFDYLQLMNDTSMLILISVLAFFAIVKIIAGVTGGNRRLNALVFPVLIPVSLLFISVLIFAEGIVITYALFELQALLMGKWFPVVTGAIGLGAAVLAFGVLAKTFTISSKTKIHQRAVILEDKNSELWTFVSAIANSTSSPVPENIVLGLEPNFYATGADVYALSSDKTVSGETLYVSLPLMRLFSKDELAAVIGHELGHFKGGDAIYSLKFAPIYRSLATSINTAEEAGGLMSIPALGALTFLYNAFEKNEKKISRDRELEADKVGAEASSAEALIHALVKLTVFTGHWSALQSEVIENLRLGRPVNNMSQLYAASVSYDTNPEAAQEAASRSGEARVAHPTDSHPSTGSRAEALGVRQDTIEKTDLCIPDKPSIQLVADYRKIEEELSVGEQTLYVALGVEFESEMPQEENPFAAARIGQTAAALMVCADGKVEPSEIEAAEILGMEILPYFNKLEFRELCLNPSNLPDVDSYSEALGSLPANFIEQLLDLLERIAHSDGELDINEAEYLKKLKGYLNS